GDGSAPPGRGWGEGKPVNPAAKYVSKGLARSRADKLVVMSGGAAAPEARPSPVAGEGRPGGAVGGGNVTAFGGAQAATALREEEQKLSPAERLEHLPWTESRAHARAAAAEKPAEANAKGYQGEARTERR